MEHVLSVIFFGFVAAIAMVAAVVFIVWVCDKIGGWLE